MTGTHTIKSLPFGSGIFVGGIPLNNSAILQSETLPGSYIIEPFSATFVFFEKNELLLAGSTFSISLWPADLQLVVSAIDFDWDLERIAPDPAFWKLSLDLDNFGVDLTSTTLDKRFSKSVVDFLLTRGLKATQAGYIDTGMLVTIKRDPATGV